ncbi:hypothetical protein Pelo_19702 [Pelomyxa schiedti]|nr:hypothetical protein Pelo_19702 [Pelomyxa schiedti]
MNPILLASGSVIHLESTTGTRTIGIADWFVGYRKVAMTPEEVIVKIFIPFTKPNEFVGAFKQSRRLHDDIAIVTACFDVVLSEVPNEPATTIPSTTATSPSPVPCYGTCNTPINSEEGFVGHTPNQALFPATVKKFVVQSCALAFGSMDFKTRLYV